MVQPPAPRRRPPPNAPRPPSSLCNHPQGAGQNLYTAIVRWYQKDALGPVILRPPFYAFMLFKQAVRSRSRMLPAAFALPSNATAAAAASSASVDKASAGIKVWPLWGEPEKELRVVVINKRPSEAAEVLLRVAKPGGYGSASVTRLVAAGDAPLEAKGGVTLGGITYGNGGKLQGSQVVETVKRESDGGRLAWRIAMPPGSAALVVVTRLF